MGMVDERGWSHLVKLQVVVKLVKLEGLGVGSLRLRDEDLLA